MLPLLPFPGHPQFDFLIFFRLQIIETKVFQFRLDPAHPQTDGNRGINFQGFLGDLPLLFLSLKTQGAHIVQSVGQFDQDDPDIIRHG